MYITTMGVVNKKLTLLKEDVTAEYRSGSLNIDKIVFNFKGSEWENLSKIAVFVTKSLKIYEVPLIDNYCIVPMEAYLDENLDISNVDYTFDISDGLYGITIDSGTNKVEKILPTNLVKKTVRLGSYLPGEVPSGLPTAEQWEIYLDEINRLATLASQSAEEATSALEEIRSLAETISQDAEDAEKALEDIQDLQEEIDDTARDVAENAGLTKEYMDSTKEYMDDTKGYRDESLDALNSIKGVQFYLDATTGYLYMEIN